MLTAEVDQMHMKKCSIQLESRPVLMNVPIRSEMIANLVRRGALAVALYDGSAEDGKPTESSVVEILTNNCLHKHCR